MGIQNLISEKKLTYSFEVFPPKQTSSVETIYHALEHMKNLRPDYISVTYGAGGAGSVSTAALSSYIQEQLSTPAIAHLTGLNSSKENILRALFELKEKNISDILALRGDRQEGIFPKEDFKYASDLVSFIKRNAPEFFISVAGYPEGHPESGGLDGDVENLLKKVDAGAECVITQLFFDNGYFFDYLNRLRRRRVFLPVQAGIMPVVNKKQIERIVSLCGATFPPKFKNIVQKYQNDNKALFDAGIAYATEQITNLIASGVDGIHLYTMNSPGVAAAITKNIESLIAFENREGERHGN